MADKRTCFVCGKKYNYCPICSADEEKPRWYFLFCSEECHDLDQILSKYTHKEIEISEAKKQIVSKNLSNVEVLDADIKNCIETILSYKEQVVERKEEHKNDAYNNNNKIVYSKNKRK